MSVVRNLLNFYSLDAAAELFINPGGSRYVCNQEQHWGFLSFAETRRAALGQIPPLAEQDPGLPVCFLVGSGKTSFPALNCLPVCSLLVIPLSFSPPPALPFPMEFKNLKVQKGLYDPLALYFLIFTAGDTFEKVQ